MRELAQALSGYDQTLLLESFDVGIGTDLRVAQGGPRLFGCLKDSCFAQIKLMFGEDVGMHRFQIEWRKSAFGKVFEVESNNGLGTGPDCRRQNMTVVVIGQIETLHKRFIALHEAVRHRLVHQLAGPLEAVGNFRTARRQVANPLLMDIVRPLRGEKTGTGQAIRKSRKGAGYKTQAS